MKSLEVVYIDNSMGFKASIQEMMSSKQIEELKKSLDIKIKKIIQR